MSKEQMIRLLKNPELRAEKGIDHPAGSLAKELDESILANVVGGCGSGGFPSITAECTCHSGITECSWAGRDCC
ncbi:hypothetical protein [Thermoactinomyces mirandus]|uniref:Lantibiotic n=1 Tax=Thermoactinomyces mirandus TaxID=2756294 RepID=A0A7W1XPU5_9BACL|nr:hypothetical protein [Thermoactinomyces mirandus]MBA4601019.1 hypothetical protein [Thermoactinomyces mirandus]